MTTKKERAALAALKQIQEKINAAKALVKEAKDIADAAEVSFVIDISGDQQYYTPGDQAVENFESSDDSWDDSGCTF